MLFEDENLALAVLQSMIWPAGLIPEPDYAALRRANPYDRDLYWEDIMLDAEDEGIEFDSDEDREEYFQEACGYEFQNHGVRGDLLTLLESNAGLIPQLTVLRWHIPCEVVRACWPQWDGESTTFDLTSLAGIERCTGLTEIDIQSLPDSVDLTPLSVLPNLRTVTLNGQLRGSAGRPAAGRPAAGHQ
ncbi:DUF6892 domain-containing protein [Dactylosporangium sp. CA-233914]|uniref:DUF6892 domain-containing protein n=1 Tax=Dactylosporangium sp. CA-233914 TaxID=3239934 RepID=UPI003D8C1604